MPPHRPTDREVRRRRAGVLGLAAVTAAVVLVVVAGTGSHRSRPSRAAATGPARISVPTSTTAAVVIAPSSAEPTTTIDPGELPQTAALPTASDPAFTARMEDLWRSIVSGDTAVAQAAFFPLSAYIQVKDISDPVHDYQTRLIADYDQDIESLHHELGPSAAAATFAGVQVPDTAEWIVPGVEYNKGSYYRVYSSSLLYSVAGVRHSIYVASLISWRGEWYVVHLSSIR